MHPGHSLVALVLLFLFWSPTARASVSFDDDAGRPVRAEKPFTRVVSLYGAHTENLFALGLDAEIVGVGENDDWPPAARCKPQFGFRDDAERFIAARPDLVLIRPMVWERYRHLVEQLERSGIVVVALQPLGAEDIVAYWRRLGALVGRTAAAEEMAGRFEAGLARARGLVAMIPATGRKRVFFEAIHAHMKTFSPASTAMFALHAAGGINAAADAASNRGTNIADYGHERILAIGSTIDVYLAQRGPMNRITARDIREAKGFQGVKAVAAGAVCVVDEALVSRPTLRLLEGIQAIGGCLYPERFKEVSALRAAPVLSRAGFAELLVKMLTTRAAEGQEISRSEPRANACGGFVDVRDWDLESGFIWQVVELGLVAPLESGRFVPERPLDCATMAAAFERATALGMAGLAPAVACGGDPARRVSGEEAFLLLQRRIEAMIPEH